MKKTILTILCAVALIVGLPGCGGCSKAPKIDDVFDRVVELTEEARQLNTAFYGAGLPTYDKESPIYRDVYDADMSTYKQDYSIVDPRCGLGSVAELKEAAEKVYSPELLKMQVYPAVFDGLTATIGGASAIAVARYQEEGGNLYCLDSAKEETRAELVFDYGTMKIIRPSNAKRVLLTVDAWEVGKPEEKFSYRLILANVDGIWYLDNLTV